MFRRDFVREGLGYRLAVPELMTEIAIDRITRKSDGVHGDLVVMCGLPGTKSADGHIHQARFNLSSSTARGSLAKVLEGRAKAPEVDWFDLLEDLCRRVMGAEREGDPIEKVGALPVPLAEEYRLTPMLPKGQTTILYGDGGTGKSTIAVAVGVSIQEGVAVVPGWVPRQAPVLYLDWEAGREALNRRVRGVAMGAHIPRVVTIDYLNCRRRGPLHAFAEDIARAVDREGYGLVVVDSVGMASGTGGDGGDANETAIRLFTAFGYLGTTVLAIDHINRTDADLPSKRSRPYGSVYKSNLARMTFELRRSEDGTSLGIYHTKANDAEKMAPQSLQVTHADDGSIVYDRASFLSLDLTASLNKTERIANLLTQGPLDADDIAIELDDTKRNIAALLYKFNGKRFNKLPSGKWEVLPEVVSDAG